MLQVGADVEHGLYLNNNLISAIGKIPGSKVAPHPLPNGGGLQVDNVLLEYNIPPAKNEDEFVINILGTIQEIQSFIPSMTLGYDSWYEYPESELNHPMAWLIGCESDRDAWTWLETRDLDLSINPKPSFSGSPIRTAAGHIHVSEFFDVATATKFLRLCDLYLGIPSLFLDTDRYRRTLYGKAGAFRFKTYQDGTAGCEYRSLGTFWTKNEILIRWVFRTVQFLYENVEHLPEPDSRVREAMNTYNIHLAQEIAQQEGIQWPV